MFFSIEEIFETSLSFLSLVPPSLILKPRFFSSERPRLTFLFFSSATPPSVSGGCSDGDISSAWTGLFNSQVAASFLYYSVTFLSFFIFILHSLRAVSFCCHPVFSYARLAFGWARELLMLYGSIASCLRSCHLPRDSSKIRRTQQIRQKYGCYLKPRLSSNCEFDSLLAMCRWTCKEYYCRIKRKFRIS